LLSSEVLVESWLELLRNIKEGQFGEHCNQQIGPFDHLRHSAYEKGSAIDWIIVGAGHNLWPYLRSRLLGVNILDFHWIHFVLLRRVLLLYRYVIAPSSHEVLFLFKEK